MLLHASLFQKRSLLNGNLVKKPYSPEKRYRIVRDNSELRLLCENNYNVRVNKSG